MAAIYKHTAILLIFAMGFSSASEARAATYDVALKDALAKNDVKICDTINTDLFFDDMGFSAEQAQAMCRIAVSVASGKAENCISLNNKRRSPSESTEQHLCLEQMALSSKRPEICAMISPEGESTEETLSRARCKAESKRDCQLYNDIVRQPQLFQDSCRLKSIIDFRQCSVGFHDPATQKRLSDPDNCVFTIAVNTRNAGLCAMATSPEKRGVCKTNVKQWQDNDTATNDPGAGHCKNGCP